MLHPRTSASFHLVTAAGLLAASAARAFVPHAPQAGSGQAAPALPGSRVVVQASNDAAFSAASADANPGYVGFRAAAGGTWWTAWDRRTDRPALIWGSGLPWIPGRGNDLSWRVVSPAGAPASAAATLDLLEARARAFLSANSDLFRIPDGVTLARDPVRSGSVGDRVWQLTFSVSKAGVPVQDALVTFRLNSGNVIQFGMRGIGDSLSSAPTAPALSSADALERAVGALAGGASHSPRVAEARPRGTLVIVPVADDPSHYDGAPGQGLDYRLAWRSAFRLAGGIEHWQALVDAGTGALLSLDDTNKYTCSSPTTPTGRVTGGVFLGPIETTPEAIRGMPYAAVTNGSPLDADFNGDYAYTVGQPASTALQGQFFNTSCQQCSNPTAASVTDTASGDLPLGLGGNNNVGNGASTKAERNAFYHLNYVRQIAMKHLTDAEAGGYFSRLTPATVNIPQNCNAYFDGNGVNFFQAGGGCNNTGEIADVMQHEWGHGLDQFTGGGTDGARGEGLGDTVGFMTTHNPILGPYFVVGDPTGVRNSDENVTGVYTVSNIGTFCPQVGGGGGGPLGYEVHCEGQIFSEANWHLARNMRTKDGEVGGWHAAERLFFRSLPLSDTYLPNQARSAYDAVIAVDDDNGNLADGTPNSSQINDAYGHHEIAGTPPVFTADVPCTAPAAPALTATAATDSATGQGQVTVTWTANPGAVEYDLQRNDASGSGSFRTVAQFFPPYASPVTYLDDNVTDGVTYQYRAIADDNHGCVSQNDDTANVTVPGLVHLGLASWALDDSPAGNDNQAADPGETFTLTTVAANQGASDAPAVTGTLASTDPGVTITTSTTSYGDIAAGAQAPSTAPHFVVQLSGSVACGTLLTFELSLQTAAGCAASSFQVQVGEGGPPNWTCEAPNPRPRLSLAAVIVSDGAAAGGTGNADGHPDPGEVVKLPMDLQNSGNRDATRVTGTLALSAPTAGVTVTDAAASWPDIAVGATQRSGTDAPPHFEITLDTSVTCGASIDLMATFNYSGPSGAYVAQAPVHLVVGHDVDVPLFFDDMESGPGGWTHGPVNPGGRDDFQLGAPTATAPTDPQNGAHSGTNVWGTDLGAGINGNPSDGNYYRNADYALTTQVIDCTNMTGVHLSFWRWLAVEDATYDQAQVKVNGQRIWINPTGVEFADTAWTFQDYDISALADGNANVQVSFTITSDGGLQFGGWNLDDVSVYSHQHRCVLPCNAPAPPASPGPVLRATGNKSTTHAEFTWVRGGPPGAGEAFELYRGTNARLLPNQVLPADFSGLTYDDTSASGALLFYTLEKVNCAGESGP